MMKPASPTLYRITAPARPRPVPFNQLGAILCHDSRGIPLSMMCHDTSGVLPLTVSCHHTRLSDGYTPRYVTTLDTDKGFLFPHSRQTRHLTGCRLPGILCPGLGLYPPTGLGSEPTPDEGRIWYIITTDDSRWRTHLVPFQYPTTSSIEQGREPPKSQRQTETGRRGSVRNSHRFLLHRRRPISSPLYGNLDVARRGGSAGRIAAAGTQTGPRGSLGKLARLWASNAPPPAAPIRHASAGVGFSGFSASDRKLD